MRRLYLLPLIFVGLTASSLLAQSTPSPKDDLSFVNRNSSAPLANLPSLVSTSSAGRSPAGRSATVDLSSLPPDAQGPISAALGRDDSGYWFHPSAEGFRAENVRQALTIKFTRQGAEVRSHNLGWRLGTRGYGYGDVVHPVKAVAPQAKANRVEYQRDGLTEWYENGPLGLEQGFTLARRPGKASAQALTLELGLHGDLVAAPDAGGKALELRGKDGKAALRYTGLQARDATGRKLQSWLEVRGGRLLMRVKDEGASYPVVVDPWVAQAELTASDGLAYDGFGASVSISNNLAVVGAPWHPASAGNGLGPGSAYVFVQNGTIWTQQAELTASDGAAGDLFGSSTALEGSTIVVGAPCHRAEEGFCGNVGAVYVFVQDGTTWSQQAELTASGPVGGDMFGQSVAISGGTVVVGAPWYPYSDLGPGPGAAFVFIRSGDSWSQQAELTSSDGQPGDFFGNAVEVNASTVVVGADCHALAKGGCGPGAAYVFVQGGSTWSQQAELTAPDGAAGDDFGSSVAINGTTAVVGARSHNSQQGAAYVFVQTDGTWTPEAELTASDGEPCDFLGWSVALSGGTAVVGAPGEPSPAGGCFKTPGAAYIFGETAGTWGQEQELSDPNGALNDGFGWSVAMSGSTVLAGAPSHMVGSNQGQGAAFLFGSTGPLYTLSAAPNTLEVEEGGQVTSTISITPWNGFSGSVSFSASSLPNGITATFNPNPAASTTTLTLAASGTAATGVSKAIVTGTSGTLAQTTPPILSVTTSATLSPGSLNFGKEAVNNTSKAVTTTLTNTGTSALNVGNATTSGNFAVAKNTCGLLKAGKNCHIDLTFTPTELGTLTGTLSVSDSAAGSPQTIALLGTGTAQATLTPSGLTFGTTQVGATSPAKKVTLTNNLATTLTGISYTTTGPFAASTSNCTSTLDSKKYCAISVTFSPTQTGTATGMLTVSDSANNSPQTVSLSGTSEAVYVSPPSVDFGDQSAGTTSDPIKVDLFNEGSQQITFTSVSASGDFAVTENYCMDGVKPNTHCYVEVVFSPTQSGPLSGITLWRGQTGLAPLFSPDVGTL